MDWYLLLTTHDVFSNTFISLSQRSRKGENQGIFVYYKLTLMLPCSSIKVTKI